MYNNYMQKRQEKLIFLSITVPFMASVFNSSVNLIILALHKLASHLLYFKVNVQ